MKSIVEQARQLPRNATPLAWDSDELCYPGVNTCLCVTTIGKKASGPSHAAGMLVGLHLGLFMGAGEEGGKGSEESKMIDDAYLDMYLHVLKLQTYVRGGGAEKIYLAGALGVWMSSAPDQWRQVKNTVAVWSGLMHAPVEEIEFDDAKSMTVDIYVNRDGVRFTVPGDSGKSVPRL